MFKTLSKFFVAIIIFLVFLETLLHITGVYYISEQDTVNQILPIDSEKIKILTVGDSTTDESFAVESGVVSWPTQLQASLNNAGYKVKIYNKAISGNNSYFIVGQIEDHIEKYNPKIVIAMMGANDSPSIGVYQSVWFDKIKVLKLIKNYQKFFLKKYKDRALRDFVNKNEDIINKTHAEIVMKDLSLKDINELINTQSRDETELFYFKVALIEKLLFSSEQIQIKKNNLLELINETNQSK
ncbi:MAG: SGNH/GDSL hydrolase family protein, partial [Pseudobdellovibrio sp.]